MYTAHTWWGGLMIDNIQFDKELDSSLTYKSFDDWFKEGVSAFCTMISQNVPDQLKHFDSKEAMKKALIECAELIDGKSQPLVDTLAAYYQYAIMDFIKSIYSHIPNKLIPDTVTNIEDYISHKTKQLLIELSKK